MSRFKLVMALLASTAPPARSWLEPSRGPSVLSHREGGSRRRGRAASNRYFAALLRGLRP